MFIVAIKPDSLTAGLSPRDNKRTEVFLAGCKLAASGHPCPDCFNKDLWFQDSYHNFSPEDVAKEIIEIGNPYVTIVGGEPLDQYSDLLILMSLLNSKNFHIVLITHYTMKIITEKYTGVKLFANVIIDGVYQKDKRIFDTSDNPGVKHVIGSYNQKFWHRSGLRWRGLNLDSDLTEAYRT